MKKILSFIIGITFIFASSKEGDIGFRYGFLTQPSYDSGIITVLSDSSIIHTGDFLKILHSLGNESNVFIISHKGEILYDKFKHIIKFEKIKNFSKIL